jgi:NAD(P)-dependent dehydrogenase (short-subunit alcohol dehydrogenase family)
MDNKSGILSGKAALITGAASGIGKAAALKFAGEGARLVLADVNEKDGQAVVTDVKKAGGEAIFVKCDVSNNSEVEALIAKGVETYGRLDCAFNNAGIPGQEALTDKYSVDDWDRVIGVNLKGVWLCMKYEIGQMLKQGKGSIVNTSSIAGLVALRGHSAYAASKGGINQITRTAAVEYGRKGIHVNAICPGWIDTPILYVGGELTAEQYREAVGEELANILGSLMSFTPTREQFVNTAARMSSPMGRMGSPQEACEVAAWLCSDSASYITGQCLAVDGGLTAQ